MPVLLQDGDADVIGPTHLRLIGGDGVRPFAVLVLTPGLSPGLSVPCRFYDEAGMS